MSGLRAADGGLFEVWSYRWGPWVSHRAMRVRCTGAGMAVGLLSVIGACLFMMRRRVWETALCTCNRRFPFLQPLSFRAASLSRDPWCSDAIPADRFQSRRIRFLQQSCTDIACPRAGSGWPVFLCGVSRPARWHMDHDILWGLRNCSRVIIKAASPSGSSTSQRFSSSVRTCLARACLAARSGETQWRRNAPPRDLAGCSVPRLLRFCVERGDVLARSVGRTTLGAGDVHRGSPFGSPSTRPT